MPPATVSASPLTCRDMTGEAKKRTAAATSAGAATRRSGMVRMHLVELPARGEGLRGHRRDRPARVDQVDARPGIDAHDLVLEAEREPAQRGLGGGILGVAGLPEAARGRADEDRSRRRRPSARGPEARRAARKARAVHRAPRRSVSITSRTRASGRVSRGTASGGQMPALTTHTSTRPKAATAARIAASSSSGRRTSAVRQNAIADEPGRSPQRHSRERPAEQAATRAPSATKARTSSSPMPPDAPVTTATLSSRPRFTRGKVPRAG